MFCNYTVALESPGNCRRLNANAFNCANSRFSSNLSIHGKNIIALFHINSLQFYCVFSSPGIKTAGKVYLAEKHSKLRWKRSKCFNSTLNSTQFNS